MKQLQQAATSQHRAPKAGLAAVSVLAMAAFSASNA
ncbi:MAG: hypothetical protein JWP52_3020, partial [Rhizobacter sp.]|nr:hypothetical protein [Rhizobacter sp.]